MMLVIGLQYTDVIIWRDVPSVARGGVRAFIMKTYWILSKAFSTSPGMIICKVGTGYKAKEELM